MPFDNSHQTPFGDIELLVAARSGVSNGSDWVKGRFREGNRHCLVAVLSLVSDSRSLAFPNRTERRLTRLLARQLPPRFPRQMGGNNVLDLKAATHLVQR